MRLERVCRFLETVDRYRESTDGTQATLRCPYCGDSDKSGHGHFSIKLDIKSSEAMPYQCFRAICGRAGILTTETLQSLGCTDMETLMELAVHNSKISRNIEKGFITKESKGYEMVNLPISDNIAKLEYLNRRLGIHLEPKDLRQYKIQLSLYDFLNLNNIQRLAYSKPTCDNLDAYTIGFLSMYNDYMICRDITPEIRTGLRYTIYRTSGKPSPDDMKLYSIPTELDLLDPNPAEINIAEGTFSILGAYLHGDDIGKQARNNIWLANCGTGYHNTIMHVVKQYGLLDGIIHIWSDSEIKLAKYESVLEKIRNRMNVIGMYVHYNTKAEDFGHPANKIEVNTIRLEV